MSPQKNVLKTNEGNAPSLTTEKKAQKSKKRRRKLVKKVINEQSAIDESISQPSTSKNNTPNTSGKIMNKFLNDKSKPGESSSALPTSENNTPKSLKRKRKIFKKSSNEKSKLGESSSAWSSLKKATLSSPNSKDEIVIKSSEKKPMATSSKEIKNSQNLARKTKKKLKAVKNKKLKPEAAKTGAHSGKEKLLERSLFVHIKNDDMKNLGGFIFMCNEKTKRDCYQYRVMGVQESKKDIVRGIKPGMKLFLFDYSVKLLYGVYKATSDCGMRLEPAAFHGGFPLQVRFDVHKDCLPLPESVFKKALLESHDDKTHKFRTALTIDEVKRLTNLFKPAPILHPNPQPVVHKPNPIVSSSPLLLTEQDYRSYGLRGDRPNPIVSSSPLLLTEQDYRSYGLRGDRHSNLVHVAPSTYDPYRPDLEREGARTDPVLISRPEQETIQLIKPTLTSPPVLLTEQEYRSYGLRGERPPVYDTYKPDHERDRPRSAHPDTVYLSRPSEFEIHQRVQLVNPTLTSPPVLLTEQDYRSYGLRGDRAPPATYDSFKHPDQERDRAYPDRVYFNRPSEQESDQRVNPTLSSPPVLLTEQGYTSYGDRPPPVTTYDSYRTDQERNHSGPPPSALFLTEKDYRTYGLKSRKENPTSNMDARIYNSAAGFHQSTSYNPSFDQDSDLVERYLPHHMTYPSRLDPEPLLSERRVERLYPVITSNESLNYSQNVGPPRVDETEYKFASVASRYAFAGPSVVHR